MDSRDIKEEPGKIQDGRFLEEIYSMQKNLLSNYIGIEGLPQYPIDVNTKASQILLKDFTGRVIEELSEGYESFQLVSDIYENHCPDFMRGKLGIEYIELLNHLQNANEENADAIHFMVELLIYANIQPEDIQAYMDKWKDKNLGTDAVMHLTAHRYDTLYQAMFIGLTWFGMAGDIQPIAPMNCASLIRYYLESDSDELPEYNEKLLVGGNNYNAISYRLHYPYMLWYITHHLNIARNFLKNKPWKQSEMMTQEIKYQEELVKAFIYMCGYFARLGMDSENVFYIYFKKNHINQFRIKSKY